MKTKSPSPPKSQTDELKPAPDVPELALSCAPSGVLTLVRSGHAAALPTKALNVFYVLADSIEKGIRTLKEICKPVIIARRDEGKPNGAKNQHREFAYQIPGGEATLTVQERMPEEPNPEKLEALLKSKDLWDVSQTTFLDMEKVNGLRQAGLITEEEFTTVCNPSKPTYALIAKFQRGSQQ